MIDALIETATKQWESEMAEYYVDWRRVGLIFGGGVMWILLCIAVGIVSGGSP